MQHQQFVTVALVICVLVFVCNADCSISKTATLLSDQSMFTEGTEVELICWEARDQSIEGDNEWVKVTDGDYTGYVADWFIACGGRCSRVCDLSYCDSSTSSSELDSSVSSSELDSSVSSSELKCPVNPSDDRLSLSKNGKFGDRNDKHKGIDIQSYGRKVPIYAAMGGKVSSKKNPAGYGNVIDITHEDDIVTRYAHLDSFNVTEGKVNAGKQIGVMGSSGNSTGIHLHFEWLVNGKPVDPCTRLSSVCGDIC